MNTTPTAGQYVIVCAGPADRILGRTRQPPPVGQYLRAYHPDAHNGRGLVDWTADLRLARRFASFAEAFECWRQVPPSRPTREDGKPNRPMTAFTITIDPVPDH